MYILSSIVFFCVISSGCAVGVSFFERNYEESLPISCSLIVLILFCFGLSGHLLSGFYFIIALSIVFFLASLFIIIKKSCINLFFKQLFTPAFFVFVLFFFIFVFCEKGMLLCGNDEFSHWGYIVKIMTFNDDLGTNPIYNASYPSYPPGMALFQYLFQKINWLITGQVFVESYLYTSYFVFFFSFILPFLYRIKIKDLLFLFISASIIFLYPLLFFSEIYSQINIDSFLGLMSCIGLAYIFLDRERDAFFSLRVLCIISILVLTKDAGLFFAIILAAVFSIDSIIFYFQNKKNSKKIFLFFLPLFSVMAVALPKFLWSYNIYKNEAHVSFPGKVDLIDFFSVLIRRNHTYRQDVWEDFFRTFLSSGIKIGNSGIVVTYLILFLTLLIFVGLLSSFVAKQYDIPKYKQKLFLAALIFQSLAYIIGIAISYMYKFSEYEASILASYNRYISVIFLGIWTMVVLLIIYAIHKLSNKKNLYAAAALFVLLTLVPVNFAYDFILKEHVVSNNTSRSDYQSLCDAINSTEEGSRVRLISQARENYDYLTIRFCTYPHYIGTPQSIGMPFFDGDIWTVPVTAEEFWLDLYNNYDYLAIYNVNEYFIETYGHLFESISDISPNSLYKVNKENMVIEKI